MPNYDDPRIFEVITKAQLESLHNAGYILVREKEVRDAVLESDWIDEMMEKAEYYLKRRLYIHPGGAGIYHLRHRLQIIDGVYVDPDPPIRR